MENTSNILVFESSFHLSFSLPFLNYIISSISFISKVINITFSSLSIYTNVDIIQTKRSLNDVIIYQLQNRNHKSLPIYFSFYLNKDTSNNKSHVTFTIELHQKTHQIKSYQSLCKSIITHFIKEIETPQQSQTQSVSLSIPTNIKTLWNFITSWEFARLFYKEEMSNISFEGEPDKIGSIIKCTFNHSFQCECVVIQSIKHKSYYLEPIMGNLEMQEVHYSFKQIDTNNTLFTFENKFKESVTYETLFNYKERKTRLLNDIMCYYK